MHNPDDQTIRAILTGAPVVAVVGWSPNPDRPSHGVAAFLARRGMTVLRVNPGVAGQIVDGLPVYGRLSDIPKDVAVTMVDIFRRSEAVAAIVDEALAELPGLQVIWMQLGVVDEAAATKARARGVIVVQDRCPKIETARLNLL